MKKTIDKTKKTKMVVFAKSNFTQMKYVMLQVMINLLILASCTSQKDLAYLNNLPESGAEQNFTMSIPDYKLQTRDVLYITVKAMTPDGTIRDFLSASQYSQSYNVSQGDGAGYLIGYDVSSEGNIVLPVIGPVKVAGLNLEEAKKLLQNKSDQVFKDATVECKLLSFKYTVIGEVRSPGSYVNFNNYLTIMEAIGRAGGIDDFGRRDRLLVIRQDGKGAKTYTLNLQDKAILTNEAYFLLPNDVVIVEPQKKKIFNLNFPTFSAILATTTSVITTTLLLINYFGNK